MERREKFTDTGYRSKAKLKVKILITGIRVFTISVNKGTILTIIHPSADILPGATTTQNITITDDEIPTVSVAAGTNAAELSTVDRYQNVFEHSNFSFKNCLQKLSERLPVLGESPYLCRPKSVFADSFPATAGTVQWDKPNFKK